MQVLFCRSNSIMSWLIRLLTWSEWSHVALVRGPQAIEAAWPRVGLTTVADIMGRHTTGVLVEYPCKDPDATWAWALNQLGRPYDLGALFGFFLHRDWTSDRRWFCSELVAAAFLAGGSPFFRPGLLWRLPPQLLWMIPGSAPVPAP